MKLLKTVHANRAVFTTPPPRYGQVGRGSIAKTNPILKKLRTDGCMDGWTDQQTDRHGKFSRVRKLKVFLNNLINLMPMLHHSILLCYTSCVNKCHINDSNQLQIFVISRSFYHFIIIGLSFAPKYHVQINTNTAI